MTNDKLNGSVDLLAQALRNTMTEAIEAAAERVHEIVHEDIKDL